MDKNDNKQIIHILKIMKPADKAYWDKASNNIIPDDVYDSLYAKLKILFKKYPNDSRLKKYFSTMHEDQDNSFKKVRHPYHVISLAKIRTKDEVVHFLNKWNTDKTNKWYTDGFLIEPKQDGLSICMYFNDPTMPHKKLTVLTRGSGIAGNDITPEARYFHNMDIKQILRNIGNKHIAIRGEALISRHDFQKDRHAGKTIFKNERNLVSGTVMNKDPRVVSKRGVFLSTYTLLNRDEYTKNYPTELEQMRMLKSLGFHVTTGVHYFSNTKNGRLQAVKYIMHFSHQERLAVGHDIDGLVVKPNYTRNFDEIGWTKHNPEYAVAFKFQPQRALTRVKKIRYQVSASGRLTPVIVFAKPVHLFGAYIKKCTGSSLGNMKLNNIFINGYIIVKRMNDVIPKAYGVKALNKSVNNLEDPKDALPDDAVKKGKFYYIPKSDMSDSLPVMVNRWSKLVSKPCLNIMGLSDKMLTTMIKYKVIDPHEFGSLWYMNKNRFLKMPGFGEKGWNNLQKQLQNAESCPLSRVLLGLPIDNAGSTIFNPVSKRIGDMQIVLDKPKYRQQMEQKLLKEIPSIKGLGSATIPVIKQLFSRSIITQLQSLSPYLRLKDNQPKSIKKPVSEQKLTGLHLCITGKLSKSRKVFTNLIKANGGKVQGTVNGKTNYLLCNHPSSSSKYKKATKLGTKIINESQLKKLLK